MTKKALIERVEKLEELKKQIDVLKAQADAVEAEIKNEFTKKNVTTIEVGKFIIRWTPITSNRFDSTNFKKVHPGLYKKFTMQVPSRKFSISK